MSEEKFLLGFDVGGTKCAAILGKCLGGELTVLDRISYLTREEPSPQAVIARFVREAQTLLGKHSLPLTALAGLGISCGGPLDSRRGIVLSPPNLPGWDEIPVVEILRRSFPIPHIQLQNDANAGAVAEWKFGAGRGCSSMAFLTFGTGLGAGLILDGHLYSGASDMAGEVGHIRLAPLGPVGYGKAGSFEGFCSGSGIAQLAAMRAREAIQQGRPYGWCPDEAALAELSAKSVAIAAEAGDASAQKIYEECGRMLGYGLSVLIDVLNLEKIVIGSIFARSEALLRPAMEEVIARETLPHASKVCRVVPAQLGEKIGDFAALSLAAGEF